MFPNQNSSSTYYSKFSIIIRSKHTDLVIKILDYVPKSKFVLNVLFSKFSIIIRSKHTDLVIKILDYVPKSKFVLNVLFKIFNHYQKQTYRFSHKDFGLCSQIKIRPQRTICTPADNFDLGPCQNLYD